MTMPAATGRLGAITPAERQREEEQRDRQHVPAGDLPCRPSDTLMFMNGNETANPIQPIPTMSTEPMTGGRRPSAVPDSAPGDRLRQQQVERTAALLAGNRARALQSPRRR